MLQINDLGGPAYRNSVRVSEDIAMEVTDWVKDLIVEVLYIVRDGLKTIFPHLVFSQQMFFEICFLFTVRRSETRLTVYWALPPNTEK